METIKRIIPTLGTLVLGLSLTAACGGNKTGASYPMKWGDTTFESGRSEELLTGALCRHAGIYEPNCEKEWGRAKPGYFQTVKAYADANRDNHITEKEAQRAFDNGWVIP